MFGIFPNKIFDYYSDKSLIKQIVAYPNDFFLVKDAKIYTMYYYETGVENYNKIITISSITQEKADSLILKYKYIFTDAIDRPVIFNRAKILENENLIVFNKYNKEPIIVSNSLYGKTTIYKLSSK